MRRRTTTEKMRNRTLRMMPHEMLATSPPTSFSLVSSTSPVAALVTQSSLFSFCETAMPQQEKRIAMSAFHIQLHQRVLR